MADHWTCPGHRRLAEHRTYVENTASVIHHADVQYGLFRQEV